MGLETYQRSVPMHNIWYNSFIGDGNSSAYATVDKSIPNCPMVFIQKEECVNHATKRISSNLRRFVKEYKGEKLEDGKEIGGKRTLTNARSTLQKTFMDAPFVTKKEMYPICLQRYGSISSLQ